MKKRPECDWEFIIEDSKRDRKCKAILEEVVKKE